MKSESYVMPAEWDRHAATWLGWPHRKEDWPGKFEPIPWAFGEIARRISQDEIVRILVKDAAHEASAKKILTMVHANMKNIQLIRCPTDRGWMRDTGPIFVKSKSGRRILDYRFNAWAKYPEWKKDHAIKYLASSRLKLPLEPVTHNGRQVTLEGGAIDVNGRGTLLTTEECLLDQKTQVRNPGLDRKDMNQMFARHFGATNVLWLGNGIVGDDTHGHVDDLCRFVNPTTAVLVRERNPKDANHKVLEENWERAQGFKLENGKKLTVVELPMPEPLYFDGTRLPASYANFYICNAAVIVPTFNDPNDYIAIGILSDLFEDRPVIGIHAVDLVWGFGTLHCLTQQEPL